MRRRSSFERVFVNCDLSIPPKHDHVGCGFHWKVKFDGFHTLYVPNGWILG
jgi:hypothetical protein